MNPEELLSTTYIWDLYEQHKMYMNKKNYFTSTDMNNDFYNGKQWRNVVVSKSTETVSINYIKPIVNYKVGVVSNSNYAPIFSSLNYDQPEFRDTSKTVCSLLNKLVAKIWEKNKLDTKFRKVTKKSCINGESIMYWFWDQKSKMPKAEIKSKVEVMYGDENNEEIQEQPYIILRKRMQLDNARSYARKKGMSEDKILNIHGDNFTQDESGSSAKEEVTDRVTLVILLYRGKDDKIYYSESFKYEDVSKELYTGLDYYPIAHLNWEEQEGNARGVGEVEQHIQNQIEVNKTATRRSFIAKNIAYPHKVVNKDKVMNPDALNKVGSTIFIKDGSAEDINKYFRITNPGSISPDIANLQNDLINISRELAGAGDAATGQIKADEASGKAILAVQKASEQPLNEQGSAVIQFVEDNTLIIVDLLKANAEEELLVVDDAIDPITGEVTEKIEKINKISLDALKLGLKIDVTRTTSYDQMAREISIENLINSPLFLPQNQQLLEDYVNLLDENSSMPKNALIELIKRRKERAKAIQDIQEQANLLKNKAAYSLATINDLNKEGQQVINQATQNM